jgi:signal transduction histidine kinase
MEFERKKLVGYALLIGLWVLLAAWQAHEHSRVRETAQTALRNRSLDIADTLSALIRGLRFRGAIPQDRLEPVLNEMVNARTNELTRSSELISIVLLNAQNEPVAAAGRPLDLHSSEVMQKGERWGRETLTIINPVDLGALLTERATNPTVVLPPITNSPRQDAMRPPGERSERSFDRDRPIASPDNAGTFNAQSRSEGTNLARFGGSTESRRGPPGFGSSRRPPWLRGMSDADYQSLLKKRALHGLVLMLSTDSVHTASQQDLRTRLFIMLLATLAVAGIGMAWRNMSRTSDLQIRLVRASELNAHLKEMNLAAAGLAHETRNPLNIIRGLAHMISKEPAATPDLLQRSRDIVLEVDKVAAQLNEFINYSRPREVRRVSVPLKTVFVEVTRALAYDIEEKRIQVTTKDEGIAVSADEQLLRQALFNLLLNAIQAVEQGGSIELSGRKLGSNEAAVEVRDNGPGVPADKRAEIFKPYVTTQKAGTGLGLAVCQQIVLAHGWEIQCLSNEPRGAVFRISHVKLA